MEKSRKSKLSKEELRQSVQSFFEKQKKFKKVQEDFNRIKAQFNSDMEDYFQCNSIDKSLSISTEEMIDECIVVTRVQKSSVDFNADKLEVALGKKLAEQVIDKKYEVTDMHGLIAYLKECGADPQIFKSFISVSKKVDTKELDRLEDIGKISVEQVKGCYTIKSQNPYFTVKSGKDKNEDDN